jgi:hypothetical protein
MINTCEKRRAMLSIVQARAARRAAAPKPATSVPEAIAKRAWKREIN